MPKLFSTRITTTGIKPRRLNPRGFHIIRSRIFILEINQRNMSIIPNEWFCRILLSVRYRYDKVRKDLIRYGTNNSESKKKLITIPYLSKGTNKVQDRIVQHNTIPYHTIPYGAEPCHILTFSLLSQVWCILSRLQWRNNPNIEDIE